MLELELLLELELELLELGLLIVGSVFIVGIGCNRSGPVSKGLAEILVALLRKCENMKTWAIDWLCQVFHNYLINFLLIV